jgi:serine/threonine-protein kinase
MKAHKPDFVDPPRLPSDAELEIPHGADPESAIVGPIAGRYDLGKRIARGGMGIVYRAHDRLLNRTVAVKVMRGKYMDRPDLLRRFVAEARINGKLQHPGVVPVYEVGNLTDARPFIAMKLIQGQTLSRLLRERKNPAENQAHYLKVFEALCQTMAYAHQQGVIHRDLKPENVMVGAFGEVQVMDWGLAKFLNPADAIGVTPDGFDAFEKSAYLSADGMLSVPSGEYATHATAVVPVGPDTPLAAQTTAGEVFGTLAFMPPEQARGEMDRVDRRSDVFSLGAILCQILTGQPPYYGPPETLREMAREGKLFGATILLDRCGADQELVLLAKHCLSVDPDSRPADAHALAGLVTECLEGLQKEIRMIETTRLTAEARVAEAETRERLARRARRLSVMLAAAGVVVAAMLVAGLGWYAQDRGAREADEASRRTVALDQIQEALAEGETLNAQARSDDRGTLVRDAAVRQAQASCQRADALVSAIASPPDESVERLKLLKASVAETERNIRTAIVLDQWKVELFDANGEFDRKGAAERCHKSFESMGFDYSSLNQYAKVAEQRNHPDHARLANALCDWLFIDPNPSTGNVLSAVLRQEVKFNEDWSLACVPKLDAAKLTRLAETAIPDNVPAVGISIVAQGLIDADHATDAEKLLVRGVQRHPNDFNLNLQLGRVLHARNANAECVPYLFAARSQRPDSGFINLELGMALADAGRTDDAIETLHSAIKTNPKLAAPHIRLADMLAAKGQADESRKEYAEAVAIEPTNIAAQTGLGKAEFARGDSDAAAKAFTVANAGKPNAVASAGLGRIHLKKWEASKATAAFRTAVELEPNSVENRLGLIEARRIANDLVGAIGEARAAAKAIPNSAKIHRVLGDLLRATGDKPGAIAAYRATAKCEPNDVETYLVLAELYESLKDYAGAAESFEAVAKLRPDDERIKADLARVAAKVVEPPTSIEACRRILAKDPGNVAARHNLGRFLAGRGDPTAIDELKKAADADSKSGDIRVDLAEAILRTGRFREAAAMYREAASRFPEESDKQTAARTAARNAIKWAGLEVRLVEILAGAVTPTTPAAWADFGEVCRHTNRFAAAARFFAAAAEGDEKYARPAAISAAIAGFNRGIDAKELTDEKRTELRKTALTALKRNRTWVNDWALATIKEPATLAKLSPEERNEWQLLWSGETAGR